MYPILIDLEGTLMQIWKSTNIFVFTKKNMSKISHCTIIYFLSYAHPRYMKCLFTNMQKQSNMLKSSLLFKENTNVTGK